MDSPYATVIVPIIDRAETLAVGVETGLAQSCQNIEILITCSGATQPVLAVAHDFARRDGRVKVLDLPRSAVSTAQARAEALRRSRSDRIFILQDDDLWFPNHVETLGALLDRGDFATTVSMAATLSGNVAAWPCTFGHPNYRSAFINGAPKALYEAHYAFRRSSYDRLAVNWEHQTSRDCSRRLLEAHIARADTVRWASAVVPTALSLNTPPRARMTTPQRAKEMLVLRKRIEAGETAEKWLAQASYAPMFEGLLQHDPPAPGNSLPQHLMRYGLRISEDNNSSSGSDDGALQIALTDRQREDLATLFTLSSGIIAESGLTTRIVADMLEPFASSDIRLPFINLLWQTYGPPSAIDIVSAAIAAETNTYRLALLEAALGFLLLKNRDVDGAGRHWRAAEVACSVAAASSWEIAVSIALADGRNAEATNLLSSEIEAGRAHPRHFATLVEVQLARSERTQAVATMRRGLAAFPAASRLLALAQKMVLDDGSGTGLGNARASSQTHQPMPRSKE